MPLIYRFGGGTSKPTSGGTTALLLLAFISIDSIGQCRPGTRADRIGTLRPLPPGPLAHGAAVGRGSLGPCGRRKALRRPQTRPATLSTGAKLLPTSSTRGSRSQCRTSERGACARKRRGQIGGQEGERGPPPRPGQVVIPRPGAQLAWRRGGNHSPDFEARCRGLQDAVDDGLAFGIHARPLPPAGRARKREARATHRVIASYLGQGATGQGEASGRRGQVG